MNTAKRTEIFKRLRAASATPRSELEYASAFELLVAVILSAQATDKSVNLATRELYKVANTPRQILALGVAGLETYIKRIGLYRTKAKNIIATCARLLEHHEGHVPQTREALEQLPGVFCAGEMLDWEAPTGGYLLSACFASGRAAGIGVETWLSSQDKCVPKDHPITRLS